MSGQDRLFETEAVTGFEPRRQEPAPVRAEVGEEEPFWFVAVDPRGRAWTAST